MLGCDPGGVGSTPISHPRRRYMTALELKQKVLKPEFVDLFHVINFHSSGWTRIEDDQEVKKGDFFSFRVKDFENFEM